MNNYGLYRLNRDSISEEERKYVIEKSIEVGDRIVALIRDNDNFFVELIKRAGAMAVGLASVGAAVLGVTFFRRH